MYTVPEFVPKVYLIEDTGYRWTFKNIYIAAKACYKYGLIYRLGDPGLIGKYHRSADYIDFNGKIQYTIYRFIVRNEVGDIITVDDLIAAYRETKNISAWWEYRARKRKEYTFRSGPVPYTGKGNWRSCWRHPKTTAERRAAAYVRYDEKLREYNIRPRGKRNFCNLPSVWDDKYRSNVDNKSWKNQKRKHQWKERR